MDTQIKLLLVDDDERNIFALSAFLKVKKIQVTAARDGQDCLNKLAEGEFDVILLDMMMPVMDGFQTLQVIRSDAKLKNNKVIALTALAMKGDMERCLEAGADDYCTKPVDIDVLISKINKILQVNG
ncbi:MAG: response regulator [Bacteroidota bacterium]|jgi:CheY-like chemotaxis protein